tara:strand:+ start:9774 stop:10817 length:1044 start_codon:yes stop_codon:yes gene_type:complete
MLEPLQKLVRLSPPIAASLAVPEIFQRTEQKLGHKDAVTRLNLLRILRTICDAKEEGCWLIRAFGCYERISWLVQHDGAVLVRQMAEELVRASDEVDLNTLGIPPTGKRSLSRASAIGMNLRRPASSAGARRDGSGSSTASTLVGSALGLTPPTPNSLKSSFTIPVLSATPTLAGSARNHLTRSQSTAMWDLAEDPAAAPTASLRSKPPVLARSSTSFAALGSSASAQGTPPPSSRPTTHSRPPSRDAASALARIDATNRSSAAAVASERSRLPKARNGRLSEAVSRRRQSHVNGGGAENASPGPPATQSPLPRLQIVRRRRETSGGEMTSAGKGGGEGGRRGGGGE